MYTCTVINPPPDLWPRSSKSTPSRSTILMTAHRGNCLKYDPGYWTTAIVVCSQCLDGGSMNLASFFSMRLFAACDPSVVLMYLPILLPITRCKSIGSLALMSNSMSPVVVCIFIGTTVVRISSYFRCLCIII